MIMNVVDKGKYKILFADMDGTLIETKSGEDHPVDINDWRLKEDVISKIYDLGIAVLFIVSNQGGIEKGYFTKDDITKKFKRICNAIETFNGKGYCPFLVDFDFCPSSSKSDPSRKPNTMMLEKFFKLYGSKYNKTDCMMIGDASGGVDDFDDYDIKCAENFGCDYLDVDDFLKLKIKS